MIADFEQNIASVAKGYFANLLKALIIQGNVLD